LALVLLMPPALLNVPSVVYSQSVTIWNGPDPGGMLNPRDARSIFQQRLLRRFNAERQRSMVSDADKLVKLAAELNAEVGGAGQNPLAPQELRKVQEIEKLARSVNRGMRYAPGTN
jgi:hypothetical protein